MGETLALVIGGCREDFRRTKKAPPKRGLENDRKRLSLRFDLHRRDRRDVRRLQTFGTLDHVETNSLTLRQRPEAFYLDLTEMDEEILTLRLLNESVALLGTKPLDSPLSQPRNLHVFWGDTTLVPTPLYFVAGPRNGPAPLQYRNR